MHFSPLVFPQSYIVLKAETKTSYTNVTHAPLYSTRPTPRRWRLRGTFLSWQKERKKANRYDEEERCQEEES